MTTLVIGDTALAGALVIALQYGAHDYERLTLGESGTTELQRRIRAGRVAAVVDASDPVTEGLSAAVQRACSEADVPLIRAVATDVRSVLRWLNGLTHD